jgi:hypothetical protein
MIKAKLLEALQDVPNDSVMHITIDNQVYRQGLQETHDKMINHVADMPTEVIGASVEDRVVAFGELSSWDFAIVTYPEDEFVVTEMHITKLVSC